MRASVTLRLALSGTRIDGLRISLTAMGSALTTLALLAAVTVAAVAPGDGPYTSDLLNQGGLHPGVVLAFVGLCIPILVLLAQCSRIGAPARDRRLSAFRLAGAAPRDATRLVAVESGIAALAGSIGGTAVFFVLRTVLNDPVHGRFTVYRATSGSYGAPIVPTALRLPTDVALPWWAYIAVAIGVPLLVGAATAWALRRVAFTAFGTTRRTSVRTPRVAPLLMLVAGVAIFFVLAALLETNVGQLLNGAALTGITVLGFMLIVAGLLSGQGAITAATGRSLSRRTSSPALLLAARRMTTDPFAGTRSTAVLTVAVVVAAGTQRLRDVTLADIDPRDAGFYAGAYDLVDLVLVVVAAIAACGVLVACAEGIVARRRTYAAVVAAGTPRSVVGRAVLAELLLPLVPSLLLAAAAGTAAGVGFFGWDSTSGPHSRFVGIAWGPLLLTLLVAAALTAATTSVSLVFLRRATDIGELRRAA